MRKMTHALTVMLLLAVIPARNAFDIEPRGNVVRVHDGDTLTLLVDKREVKVRLVGIDAPELKGQPYGPATGL